MSDTPAQPEPSRSVALKNPPVLFEKTQKVVERIEKHLGEPFISYWNSSDGSICSNDVVGLYGLLKHIGPAKRLSLFVKSGGGSGQSSLRMVNLIRQFAPHVTALIPLECMSAATMLVLGANKILMGPLAHLSAVDTSLTHSMSPIDNNNNKVSVSQDELARVIRLWQTQAKESNDHSLNPYEPLFKYIHPLVIGAVDRTSALSTRLCIEILSYHLKDAGKAKKISNVLNSTYPSHTYPITLREAQHIGLNAEPLDTELNQLLLELNEIYSEMGQRAKTDFSEISQHDNGILNIMERKGLQIFFQNDKDWHYRKEERRWVALNDKSTWRKAEFLKGETVISVLHLR